MKKAIPPRDYVTTCKVCGLGVYAGEPYRWARQPIGVSHDVCLSRAARGGA